MSLGFLLAVIGLAGSGGAAIAQDGSLESEFQAASEEYGVPRDLLKAMGYVNTRWEMPPPDASKYEEGGPKDGSPEARGSYGIMNLQQNPSTDTLGRAAEFTGISEEELKTDRGANIRGAAAVLADMQGNQNEDLNAWFDTVSDYGGGPIYANQIYETLQEGASEEISTGETVTLESQPEAETQPVVTAQGSADYGRARWYGADSSNYTNSNRGVCQINRVVIHVTQGSFASAINWFRNSSANVSAHYTVRSKDGHIGQSVHNEDIGWHAGNWSYNRTSIGIEHEGYVNDPSWFTAKMYNESARLTAFIAKRNKIPITRNRIIGHNEIPGATHTDPGKYWDWPRYMRLVRKYAENFSSPKIRCKQVVDNATKRFRATSDWGVSSWNPEKYKKNYRHIRPKAGTGSAKFLVKFPNRGKYAIYARWPSNDKYNARARFLIKTVDGWKLKVVNQRRNGGRWIYLGTYTMPKGDGSYIRLAKRSTARGYIMADAVLVKSR